MAVYMIRATQSGAVKIGYTAKDVEKRLYALATSSPEPLVLVRVIDGDRDTEQSLHERFASLRIKGEWFIWSDEMAIIQSGGSAEIIGPSRRQRIINKILLNNTPMISIAREFGLSEARVRAIAWTDADAAKLLGLIRVDPEETHSLVRHRIHPLRRWLFLNRETTSQFAERVGLSRPSISYLMNGHTQPTLPTIMRIRKATDGGVKAADFEAFELEAAGELT